MQLIDFEKARKSVMGILAGKVTTPVAVKVVFAMQNAAVDAEEVVRCEKCKHWDMAHCSNGQGWCPKVVGYRYGRWFCAAGERKDNGKE